MIAWPEGETPVGQIINLPEAGGIVGRQEGCAVVLPDASRVLSRQHCDIRPCGDTYTVHNLSQNGLRINGESVPRGGTGARLLHDGDLLALGEYRLLVSQLVPMETSAQPAGELPAPPVLTGRVLPDPAADSLEPSGYTEHGDNLLLPPWDSRSFHFAHGLSGIDALTDEVLREFNPERLEHKLAPWRGKGWRRQSWWSLYCSYYQQMERSGELRIRLREWFLRSGGFGHGGS